MRRPGAAHARFQWIATEALDVGLGVQYSNIDYFNSDWGRTDDQRLAGVNLDVNWQPSAKLGRTATRRR